MFIAEVCCNIQAADKQINSFTESMLGKGKACTKEYAQYQSGRLAGRQAFCIAPTLELALMP